MAGVLRKILNLLIILRIYYWHCIMALINATLGKCRDAQSGWAQITYNYLKVKSHKFSGSQELKQERTMVFANHRSQADFFLHNIIMNFQTNFLSRLAVLISCPIFITTYKTVWFFNRNNKTDPDKFNQWLDKKFSESPRPALLAYPEGHRMQGSTKVDQSKIKTGMLRYAYRRQLPSQLLMTFGNQEILDEKRLHLSWNETVYYKLSQVIDPKDFKTQGEYVLFIKKRFCEFFDEVYELYLKQKSIKA